MEKRGLPFIHRLLLKCLQQPGLGAQCGRLCCGRGPPLLLPSTAAGAGVGIGRRSPRKACPLRCGAVQPVLLSLVPAVFRVEISVLNLEARGPCDGRSGLSALWLLLLVELQCHTLLRTPGHMFCWSAAFSLAFQQLPGLSARPRPVLLWHRALLSSGPPSVPCPDSALDPGHPSWRFLSQGHVPLRGCCPLLSVEIKTRALAADREVSFAK